MPSPSPLHVILHIGTEKTGTKTLQRTLVDNRKALRAQGIRYLTTPGRVEARALAAAALCTDLADDYLNQLGVQGREARQAFRAEVRQETRKTLKALPSDVDRVVISSEHFHSRLVKPVQLTRLRRLLGPRAGSFRIVCYLRRQVDLLASYYSTELKSGGTRCLEEIARALGRPRSPYCNYAGLLERWSQEFGEDALAPGLFGQKEWHGGSLGEDFVRRSGLAEAAPELTLSPAPIRNPSLNPVGQALLLALNRRAKTISQGQAAEPEWQALRRTIAQVFAGPGQKLPREQAETYQKAFDESNRQVCRRWFPDRKQLFDPIPDDYGRPAENRKQLDALERALLSLVEDDDCRTPTAALDSCLRLLDEVGLTHASALLGEAAAQAPSS
ncbi:hypothetical protein [Aquibaculum arenosum]|uniref:Sulfotransferase family protein n=1 Tax=Aquibaculum arenosum TaxID=3032591 RepID=A0ABT5YMF2_9PROT|nr:hypothetical protein [Fodinicurvata sp. CAU 1616]MDF2096141.1 hypothetical protein [Fodinicurvata sp. CAU 1616]